MNIFTDVPIKKFKGLKRVEQIGLNSSGKKELQKCPRAYFFRYVLGFTSKDEKPWFAWGKAIHKFYEIAEIEYAKTKNVDLALALGMSAAVLSWGNRKDADPADKKFGHFTRANLSSILNHAAKEWKKEKEQGHISVIQSEMHFNVMTGYDNCVTGKMDQLIDWNGRLWVRDFKTSSKKWSYYRRDLAPSDQFACYTYGARKLTGQNVTGVVVDVIIKQNDGKPPTFERETVSYTNEELADWEYSNQFWEEQRKLYREHDHYPMAERSCSFCEFREICTSRGESQQLYTLKSKYKFDPWDNSK